jgi:hypothetical protein
MLYSVPPAGDVDVAVAVAVDVAVDVGDGVGVGSVVPFATVKVALIDFVEPSDIVIVALIVCAELEEVVVSHDSASDDVPPAKSNGALFSVRTKAPSRKNLIELTPLMGDANTWIAPLTNAPSSAAGLLRFATVENSNV